MCVCVYLCVLEEKRSTCDFDRVKAQQARTAILSITEPCQVGVDENILSTAFQPLFLPRGIGGVGSICIGAAEHVLYWGDAFTRYLWCYHFLASTPACEFLSVEIHLTSIKILKNFSDAAIKSI